MAVRQRRKVSYGLSDPLVNNNPEGIIAQRAPLTTDKAEILTVWIDQTTNSFWMLTSIVDNVANWEPGGGAATVERLAGNSGTAVPAGGTITITGTQGALFTGAGSTLTNSYERLELGTAAARLTATNNAFSANGNNIQSYVDTTGGAAGTSYSAGHFDINVVTGNGTEFPDAMHAEATAATAADLESLYASFSLAVVEDGSAIDTDAFGMLGSLLLEETDAADQPQGMIAGSYSAVSFDAGAAIPTANIVAGSISDVGYDSALNGVAHGFVVTRSDESGGSTGGSAFKVIHGGAALDDWNYGLDLFNGAGQDYATADVRLWSGATMITSVNSLDINLPANHSMAIQLGDAAGSNRLEIEDSASGTAWFCTSDGEVQQQGNLQLNSEGTTLRLQETGTATTQGIATLVAGAVTVSTTAVTANSRIQLTSNVDGGTPGFVRVSSRVVATSFTITSSSGTDTSQIAWIMTEPS